MDVNNAYVGDRGTVTFTSMISAEVVFVQVVAQPPYDVP